MAEVNLEGLVDKLAEKLGVAVEQVMPLAKETVEQYQTRAAVGMLYGAAQFLFGVFFGVVAYYMLRWFVWEGDLSLASDNSGRSITYLIVGFIAVVLALCMMVAGIDNSFDFWARYVAPLPYLLDVG